MLGALFAEEEGDVDISTLGFSSVKSGIPAPSLPRPQCGLSGISNQGATCYLNSLLQTLLFTPEFRENLFLLSEDELGSLDDKDKGGAKVRVIPLELQRLFVRLLLSDRQSLPTTDLTNSFGWTNNEELQQHDVQELNRILFSAIEESLVGTAGSDLINRLYHGKIVNQIICSLCGKVSEREEDFLDLCVTVAGSDSLEKGLYESYCQMETMDGKNQYKCEKCNKLVNALKGAKLRSLPEILTISLLRFSYDFIKQQRYKETGKFVFPMQLNMAKYYEQNTSEEEIYELFSVVIHRGGAYGGHYYAYLRDVDGIGTWTHPEEETIHLPADPSTGEIDFIECDSPVELVQAILARRPDKTICIDKLGGEISKQTGVSWNKRFKKFYGPLNKFLQKYDDKFVVEPSSNQVSLRTYSSIPTSGGGDPSAHVNAENEKVDGDRTSKRSHSPQPEVGQCWFSFDDVRVHPIREQEIQKTFSGKSSAYMLFYRKADMNRPQDAIGNPCYQIPDQLVAEVLTENEQLRIDREEYDLTINKVNLQIHFHQWFHYKNGALHPRDYQNSFMTLAIDRRKTVEDLKIAVMELGGELIDQEFVIHRLKEVPSGFHLYDEISVCHDKQLKDIYIEEGTMLFIWDGVQVDGAEIQAGILYEPVLVNLSTSSQENVIIRGFPKNMTLRAFRRCICDDLDLNSDVAVVRRVIRNDEVKVVTFTFDQYDDTLSELKVKDGDEILVEEESKSSSKAPITTANPDHRKIVLTVENRCQDSHSGSGSRHICKVEVETSERITEVKKLALSKFGYTPSTESYRLRVDDPHIGLRPPLYEETTVEGCGLNKFSQLVLEHGEVPKSNQISLTVTTFDPDIDLSELELTLDRNATVNFCLQCTLNRIGISDDSWHLRKTNWCGEAAEVLDDLDSTLEACLVQHGDRLLLEKGRIPPKGYFRPAIWLYPTLPRSHVGGYHTDTGSLVSWITNSLSNLLHGNSSSTSHPNDLDPVYLGEVEISLQSNLDDLKIQILTLDKVSELSIPMVEFMRVRVFDDNRLGGILRGSNTPLQKLKLKSCEKLAIQILPQEENLSPDQIILELVKRIPSSKEYEPPTEVLWDVSQGATVHSLKQTVADALFMEQEHLCIAKHFPKKFEWLMVKEGPKKQTHNQKGKKKQTKTNLRQAPYSIQDGDRIGVKNLQYDPLKLDDFSTEEDERGRAELQRQAEEKRKQREEKKKQGSGGIDFGKQRRPEVALTIKVDNFRS